MLTAEQLEIQALAREFAEGEIRPHAAAWDAARVLDDDVFDKLADLGFLGMLVPEAYGGLELDINTYLLVLEALAWGDASVALTVAIHNGPVVGTLRAHATDEIKEAWLPRLAAGEALAGFALSEPAAGSDAGGLDCRAVRDGDEWVIQGSKRWVTNGARASALLLFARTGETGDGSAGISAFLVPTDADGYEVGKRERTMGLSASETVQVRLNDVRVPASHLVGDAESGFGYAMEALNLGRLGIAAQSLGIAQSAMEHAAAYAVEREQFGRAIADFGAIQEKLADMATRIHAARALTLQVGDYLQASRMNGVSPDPVGGPTYPVGAAMAKLLASETAMWVSNQAVQIFGGYGYMRDYPVEKLMRDAKGTEIYEGTSEIMRRVIARNIVHGAREKRG